MEQNILEKANHGCKRPDEAHKSLTWTFQHYPNSDCVIDWWLRYLAEESTVGSSVPHCAPSKKRTSLGGLGQAAPSQGTSRRRREWKISSGYSIHWLKIIRRGLSLCPTTFTGASGGNTRKGLLCCCSQTGELPPTRGQAGPIFAVLLQAGEDLYFQTSFPSVTGCLSRDFNGLLCITASNVFLMLLLFAVF